VKSCSVLVVSHHLDGFLRSEVAGVLHPAADPGVPDVSRTRASSVRRRRAPRALPRRAQIPSEDVPRRQPFRVTAVVAPVLFPQLRGLAPSSGPRPSPNLAVHRQPGPPWAFFPFEVSSPSGRAPCSTVRSAARPFTSRCRSRVVSLRFASSCPGLRPGRSIRPPRWTEMPRRSPGIGSRIGAEALGGKGGGGRPDMAQAGGPDGAKAKDAIEAIASQVRSAA